MRTTHNQISEFPSARPLTKYQTNYCPVTANHGFSILCLPTDYFIDAVRQGSLVLQIQINSDTDLHCIPIQFTNSPTVRLIIIFLQRKVKLFCVYSQLITLYFASLKSIYINSSICASTVLEKQTSSHTVYKLISPSLHLTFLSTVSWTFCIIQKDLLISESVLKYIWEVG